jgi:hypothetical protein
MKFEEALSAMKQGKKVSFGDLEPFDLDSIPNLTGGDYTRTDWKVSQGEPLTDEQLAAVLDQQAAVMEAEANKRELDRFAKWESEVQYAQAAGRALPPKPRQAKSSQALTYRRCAQAIRTRQFEAN